MPAITLQEAHANLPDLVHRLGAGEEIAITESGRVVARLVGESDAQPQRPGPGLCKAMFGPLPPPEDEEHLQAFAEYMP
jgi:antitoxin (DNA-binding transcriptional repressor) of toxin-antitoxin stability system